MASKRVLLGDVIQDQQKKYEDSGIDIDLGDGKVVHVPPPQLWSDAVLDCARAGDIVSAARALIGTDEYDAFAAAGGSAAMLMSIVEEESGLSFPE